MSTAIWNEPGQIHRKYMKVPWDRGGEAVQKSGAIPPHEKYTSHKDQTAFKLKWKLILLLFPFRGKKNHNWKMSDELDLAQCLSKLPDPSSCFMNWALWIIESNQGWKRPKRSPSLTVRRNYKWHKASLAFIFWCHRWATKAAQNRKPRMARIAGTVMALSHSDTQLSDN